MAEIHPELRVFKGPRLRSDTIVVDDDYVGPGKALLHAGSSPSGEVREREAEYDLSRASPAQLRVIALFVQQGDIVLSRSGAIGRVSWMGPVSMERL